MSVFRVPKDPPRELSCSVVILDDLEYGIGSFEGFVTKDTDYVTWFLRSSAGSIDDCPISGGRLRGGIARARWASEAHLRLHVDTI